MTARDTAVQECRTTWPRHWSCIIADFSHDHAKRIASSCSPSGGYPDRFRATSRLLSPFVGGNSIRMS